MACPFFGDADATLSAGEALDYGCPARLAQHMHRPPCLGSHTYYATAGVSKGQRGRRRRGESGEEGLRIRAMEGEAKGGGMMGTTGEAARKGKDRAEKER